MKGMLIAAAIYMLSMVIGNALLVRQEVISVPDQLLWVALAEITFTFLSVSMIWKIGSNPKPSKGNFVGEVYLTWFFGKGSIMFRQRYRTQLGARIGVKIHAMLLDMILPTHYATTDWSGNPYWEKHEYGINWGIRQYQGEMDDAPIFSRALPGYNGFSGVAG